MSQPNSKCKSIPVADLRLNPIELIPGDEFEILVSIVSQGVRFINHSPVFKVAEASNIQVFLDVPSRFPKLCQK